MATCSRALPSLSWFGTPLPRKTLRLTGAGSFCPWKVLSITSRRRTRRGPGNRPNPVHGAGLRVLLRASARGSCAVRPSRARRQAVGWGFVIGFELEAWLVDHGLLPAPINEAYLGALDDPLVVPELSRFNVELNGTPLPLRSDGSRRSSASCPGPGDTASTSRTAWMPRLS